MAKYVYCRAQGNVERTTKDKDGKVLDETRSELKPIRGNLLHIEVTPTLDVVLESVLLKETMLGN